MMSLLRQRTTIMFALVLVFLTTAVARGDSGKAWESTLRRAAKEFDSGRCADGWRTVWLAALAGEKRAFQSLSGMVVFRGVVPPGARVEPQALKLEALQLSLSGIDPEDQKSIEFSRNLLDLNGKSDKYSKSCLSNRYPQQCINKLSKINTVVTHKEYVMRINKSLMVGLDAYCLQ